MSSSLITGFILLLASFPCPAQDFGWVAEGSHVFPVGWTADGACIDNGAFGYSLLFSTQGCRWAEHGWF